MNKIIPWVCSYKVDGVKSSVVIMHDDGDQLHAQMSQVLPDFCVDGWYVGVADNLKKVQEVIEAAEKKPLPQAYKNWSKRKTGALN